MAETLSQGEVGIERRAKSSPSGTSYFLGVGRGKAERTRTVQELKPGWQNAQELSKQRFSRKRRSTIGRWRGKELPFDDLEVISIHQLQNLQTGGVKTLQVQKTIESLSLSTNLGSLAVKRQV